MVVTCDIQFDNNPEGTFYAGQVITGKVTLTADKAKQVKAVALKINGSASTRWTESDDKDKNGTTYWGQVDYIKTSTNLLTPTNTDTSVVIEPGIHTFSFACHIPSNCPSSFEGDKGYIRYIIQVNLIRPWKFDQTYTRAFTVLTIKNLNYESPLSKLPANTDVSKVFLCSPCKSDPLQIHVQLPQTGYVPGQFIPVNILVANHTRAEINEMCIRLVMIINFSSTDPVSKRNQETKTVAELKGDSVLRYSKTQFNYLLPIPATPPTCSTLCSIIQITYQVEVEAKINSFLYANQCINIPVVIGNVPLQMEGIVVKQQPTLNNFRINDGFDEIENNISLAKINNDLSVCNRNIEPWEDMENIPRPVYMEATHMSKGQVFEELAHDYGEKIFTPKYPVFSIPSPTTVQLNNTKLAADEPDNYKTNSTATDCKKSTWL